MDRNRGLDLNTLRQQMEDLIEDFFPSGGNRRPGTPRPGADQTQPIPINVLETDTEVVISAPLPGLGPDEIDISVRGQSLTLKGQSKSTSQRSDFVRREWGFGVYQRIVDLPVPVDAERAHAAFRKGVVTITLPRTDTSAQDIDIDGGEDDEQDENETTPTDVTDTGEEAEPSQQDAPDEGSSAVTPEVESDVSNQVMREFDAAPEPIVFQGADESAAAEEAATPAAEETTDTLPGVEEPENAIQVPEPVENEPLEADIPVHAEAEAVAPRAPRPTYPSRRGGRSQSSGSRSAPSASAQAPEPSEASPASTENTETPAD